MSRWTPCGRSWRSAVGRPWPSSISTPTANTRCSTGPTGSPSSSRTSRSSAWTAWPSPTTATCTRPGRSTSRPRPRRSAPSSASRRTWPSGPRQAREKPPWAPAAYSHLVLLAKNRAGYKNLVRLTSIGYTEGFYRRPRIDKECLEQHARGASSAWPPVSRARWRCTCAQGKYDEAKRSAEWFAERVRPRRVLARGPAARHRRGAGGHRGHAPAGAGARASAWWRPTTPTTSGARTPSRTTCCSPSAPAATSTTPKRFRFTGEESYVKSEKEMAALFPDHPGDAGQHPDGRQPSASSTSRRRYFLPGFPRPADYATRRGAARAPRPQRAPSGATAPRCRRHVAERLAYELGVINTAGYAGLLPHRPGLHRRRARARDPGRAGPRLRRRLDRGLLARDHQRLPAQVRPALRAVPQSRARVDARHRRRLLLRAPGRGDRVRPRAVRPGQRRARSSPSAR